MRAENAGDGDDAEPVDRFQLQALFAVTDRKREIRPAQVIGDRSRKRQGLAAQDLVFHGGEHRSFDLERPPDHGATTAAVIAGANAEQMDSFGEARGGNRGGGSSGTVKESEAGGIVVHRPGGGVERHLDEQNHDGENTFHNLVCRVIGDDDGENTV